MRTARRNLICASIAAAFLGGAAQAEDRGGKAEIFARLPQSVGNIAFTPDNQLIFSHHPFYEPDLRVATAHIADDVRALSECRVERAKEGNGSVPRQRARFAIRREWNRMDHRYGFSNPDYAKARRLEYAGEQARANLLHAGAGHGGGIATAGHRDRSEASQILHRRRKHRAGRRWFSRGDHRDRHGHRCRAARAGWRSIDRSGKHPDHGGRQRSDRAGQGRQAVRSSRSAATASRWTSTRSGSTSLRSAADLSIGSKPPTSGTTSSAPKN